MQKIDYKKLFDMACKELAVTSDCPPDVDDCPDEHKFNMAKCSKCWREFLIRAEVKNG